MTILWSMCYRKYICQTFIPRHLQLVTHISFFLIAKLHGKEINEINQIHMTNLPLIPIMC